MARRELAPLPIAVTNITASAASRHRRALRVRVRGEADLMPGPPAPSRSVRHPGRAPPGTERLPFQRVFRSARSARRPFTGRLFGRSERYGLAGRPCMGIITSTAAPDPSEEESLVALARRRRDDPAGEGAMRSLIERYGPSLQAIARRCAWDASYQEDLLQEATIGLIRAVDSYVPGRGPLGHWVRMWARGRCLRAGASAGALRNTARLNGDDGIDPELIAEDGEALEDLVAEAVDSQRTTPVLAEAISALPGELQAVVLSTNGWDRGARRTGEAMLRHPCLRSTIVAPGYGGDLGGASATTQAFGRYLAWPPTESEQIAIFVAVTPVPDPQGGWLLKAACAGMKPQAFFASGTDRAGAISTCRGCSVRLACLRDAVALPDRGGIRAGMTERQRRALKLYLT